MRPIATSPRRATRPLRPIAHLAAGLAAALLLPACGGGGSDPSPGNGNPAAVAISGAVVKGPVAGATVCAYALTAGAKGGALGNCAVSAADGGYRLTVPEATEILLEAVGGSYLDEATQTQASLPADLPMTSIVAGDAGAVTAYLTPLTTLATNASRAGGLSVAAFRRQATALKASFGLAAALDLSEDRPRQGGSPDAHGRALVAISKLAAGGLSLRDVLSASDPAPLAGAFRQAYAATGSTGEPTVPTEPAGPGLPASAPRASGKVGVAGGPVTAFAPDAAGFTVSVDGTDTTYRFEKQVTYSAGGGAEAKASAYIAVTRRSEGEGGPLATTIVTASLAPQLGLAGLKVRSCAGDCGIAITSPARATHPVTIDFDRFDLAGWTLDGSLSGDASGAAFGFADLPRTTTGTIRLNGAASTVTTGSVVRGSGPGGTSRQVTLRLSNGAMVTVAELFDAGGAPSGNRTAGHLAPPATLKLCARACAYTVTEDATSLTVTFNGTVLEGGAVLDGSATLRKTSGTVTSPTLGSFKPVSDSISASNDSRKLSFSVLGTPAQGGISLLVVTHRAGQVEQVSVSTGTGVGVYQCLREAALLIGVPACKGVSVAADGRTVDFADTAVGGGMGANRQGAELHGTLTARGW